MPNRRPHLGRPAAPAAVSALAPADLAQTVGEAIARGDLDGHLQALAAVLNERLRLLDAARAAITLASLRVGDRVRIGHNTKPRYLHGALGTVTGWAGQNITVQLDEPTGRFTTGQLHCPPEILEPAGPE
jgi:hypothetical protein